MVNVRMDNKLEQLTHDVEDDDGIQDWDANTEERMKAFHDGISGELGTLTRNTCKEEWAEVVQG
jgi:hypothetical protein